jgi:hypothetical protein
MALRYYDAETIGGLGLCPVPGASDKYGTLKTKTKQGITACFSRLDSQLSQMKTAPQFPFGNRNYGQRGFASLPILLFPNIKRKVRL